jgi:outer membrane protein OmpA-like peptidoglycan-associated protein
MSKGKFLLGWLGITTLCALGAYFLVPTRDGLLGKLQNKADVVKSDQFADWATISFRHGDDRRHRIAYVTGAAPSEDAKNALVAALLEKHGQLSVGMGGIHKVVFLGGVASAPEPEPVAAAPLPAPAPAPVQAEVDTCQADLDAAMTGKTIEFDTGKTALRENPNALLDTIATIMAKCPNARIEVGGHTDKRGSAQLNVSLSQTRATAVTGYLAAKGVAADHLTAKGYGSAEPVDPADTQDAYQKNRRIAFKVSADQSAQ